MEKNFFEALKFECLRVIDRAEEVESERAKAMAETVWALDPGPSRSALIGLSIGEWLPLDPLLADNTEVLTAVERLRWGILVIEMVASYGMPVGKTVFDTAFWVGRFAQASPVVTCLVYRKQVVLALCGSSRAKDSNVIRRLKDIYAEHPLASTLGSEPALGTKASPGPLYGLKRDLWQAFAIAYVVAHATSSGDVLDVTLVKDSVDLES